MPLLLVFAPDEETFHTGVYLTPLLKTFKININQEKDLA